MYFSSIDPIHLTTYRNPGHNNNQPYLSLYRLQFFLISS